MYKSVIIILVAIIIGLLSFIFVHFDELHKTDAADIRKPDTAVSTALADIQRRLSVIEERTAEVIRRRIELETLINDLDHEQANLTNIKPETEQPSSENTYGMKKVVLGQETKKDEGSKREKEITRFIEGGFSEDEAIWLVDKREKMHLDSLYEQWESRRRFFLDRSSTRRSSVDEIKERLGPEGYEKYLKSIGSTVSTVIGSVIEGAPGDLAGLKPDDEIIRYNGERVYSFMDLNDATVRGELGEPVIIDLIRNGEKIQINMERGPLGVGAKMKAGVYYTSTLPPLAH